MIWRAVIMISAVLLATWSEGVVAAERPQKVKALRAVPAVTAVPTVPGSVAPAVLSIIPSQGEPGSKVMVFGSGFGSGASAFLGSVEVQGALSDGKQMEFVIPRHLEPGLYALYLRRQDGVTSRPYNFTVLPVRPVLHGVSPESISSCAQGQEREVTVRGQNFTDSSQVVFDGAVLKNRFVSGEALAFTVPQVAGGLHQVMVRNSPENATVAAGLMVDTKPEIAQVAIGTQFVNYYELIVTGRNFQQNSSIYVDGVKIGGHGGSDLGERDKLIYVDCGRLVYQRHPYSQVDKEFRILVMNPGGEASQTINVTAP